MYLQFFLFSFLIVITIFLILLLVKIQNRTMITTIEEYECSSDSDCTADSNGKCTKNKCVYTSE
jgi:hypothetical protein